MLISFFADVHVSLSNSTENLSPILVFETHAANSYKKNKGIINVDYFSHASFS